MFHKSLLLLINTKFVSLKAMTVRLKEVKVLNVIGRREESFVCRKQTVFYDTCI